MEEEQEKQDEKDKVELNISMHCSACERSVANAVAKFKGVEKFTTDMRKHRVVIIGKIDPQKMMKKLKKKTGKKVEMVPHPKQEPEKVVEEMELLQFGGEEDALMNELVLFGGTHWKGCDFTTMFNDENPNACSMM